MIDFAYLTQNFLVMCKYANKWQTFTVHTVCIYCTNWLKVILYQEQIVRLLVVIYHENKTRISILKIPKAKSGTPEHKNGKKNIWTYAFFLSWDYVLNQHHAIGYYSCFYSCSFFKKAAIIISYSYLTKKHYTSSKVIPFVQL